jgi:hypothetical protein
MFRRIHSEPETRPGALNCATGETVAVKEIQLSNIPRGELGQIMVRPPTRLTRTGTLTNLFSTPVIV